MNIENKSMLKTIIEEFPSLHSLVEQDAVEVAEIAVKKVVEHIQSFSGGDRGDFADEFITDALALSDDEYYTFLAIFGMAVAQGFHNEQISKLIPHVTRERIKAQTN